MHYRLYIDESGKSTLRGIDPSSPYFSVSGILVHREEVEVIKRKADQIKFKYWGKQPIVLHAKDMRGLHGDFQIFRNSTKFTIDDFHNDFIDFLDTSTFKLIHCSINRIKYIKQNPPVEHALKMIPPGARKSNWLEMIKGVERKLIQISVEHVFHSFLFHLRKNKKKSKGQVIIEASDRGQDLAILDSYNQLLNAGYPGLKLKAADVRQSLTSISFVTKQNHDIETQLADLAAYFLNFDSMNSDNGVVLNPSSPEARIIHSFKEKLFNCTNPSSYRSSFKSVC